MADGVVITEGAASTPPDGTKFATDDTGTPGHVQLVKLAVSTNGDATPIPGAVGDGLLVDTAEATALLTTIDADTSVLAAAIAAEDAVAGSGDKGFPILAVRRDTPGSSVNDGDYANLEVTSVGYLRVYDATNSIPLDNISTKATTQTTHQATIAGAIAATSAASTGVDPGIVVQAIRDDALTTLGAADGDFTPLRVDSEGSLHTIQDGALSSAVDSITAVSATSGAATTAAVGDSASSVTLLASADSRKGFSMINLSSAILYVKYGSTATTTDSFIARLAQYERFGDAGVGVYTGIITGIWASDAGGSMVVTSW